MRRLLTLCTAFSLALSATAHADNAVPAMKKPSTVESIKEKVTQALLTNESFVKQAAMAGRAEIELSSLALKTSQTADVKAFAQRMVKDHTAAAATLKGIAQSKSIEVPDGIDGDHQDALAKLEKLSGPQFDQAYIEQMHKDHERVVELFTAAASDKSLDQELIGFARRSLPTLRDHEKSVAALHAH